MASPDNAAVSTDAANVVAHDAAAVHATPVDAMPVDAQPPADAPVSTGADAGPHVEAPVLPPPPDGPARAEADQGPAPPDAQAPAPVPAVTYLSDVQPVLRARCGGCHSQGKYYTPFADSYEATQRRAKNWYECGEVPVGACILQAAQRQKPNPYDGQANGCRIDRPYHRDGWPTCFTEPEQAILKAWVEGGMPEGSATAKPSADAGATPSPPDGSLQAPSPPTRAVHGAVRRFLRRHPATVTALLGQLPGGDHRRVHQHRLPGARQHERVV